MSQLFSTKSSRGKKVAESRGLKAYRSRPSSVTFPGMPESSEPPQAPSSVPAQKPHVRISGQGTQGNLQPGRFKGVSVEAAWLTTHIAMYPMGLVEEKAREEVPANLEGPASPARPDHRRRRSRRNADHGPRRHRQPLTTVPRRSPSRRGFGRVISLNYCRSPTTSAEVTPIGDARGVCVANRLRAGAHRGPPMGGSSSPLRTPLVATPAYNTLVTLGSPTPVRRVCANPAAFPARQLSDPTRPVQELNQPAPGCRDAHDRNWSDLDQIIVPQRNARIVHRTRTLATFHPWRRAHVLPVDGRAVQ